MNQRDLAFSKQLRTPTKNELKASATANQQIRQDERDSIIGKSL